MAQARTADEGELVSIADRLQPMLALRAVLLPGAVATATVLGAPAVWLLAAASVGAVALLLAAAGLRSALRGRHRRLLAITAPLVLDTLALSLAAHGAGGAASPVATVLVLQTVAIALLLSRRTAIKNAVWASMLVLVSHEAAELGALAPTSDAVVSASTGVELLVLCVLLWTAAFLTSSAAAVNERGLRRERHLSGLRAELAHRTEEDETPVGTAQALVQTVVTGLGADAAVVVDLRDGFDRMAYAGDVARGTRRELDLGPGSVLSDLAAHGDVRLVDRLDPVDDPGLDRLLPDARNLSLALLGRGDDVLGVLVTVHGDTARAGLDPWVLRTLEGLAAHAGLALDNAIKREALDAAASTDGLTGIPNRRSFDEALDTELERARRDGLPVSLAMLDVDEFKAFNDTHGHQAGDDALADVADALQAQRRTYDLAARYGGEEFVVVLPQTGHDEALKVAERLRRAVEDAREELPVTASFGVATTDDATAGADDLLEAADAALYRAKENGRNRVESARHAGGPAAVRAA